MENIELVINIPEEIYESSRRECEETDDLIIDTFTLAIGNGTPLKEYCDSCMFYREESEE